MLCLADPPSLPSEQFRNPKNTGLSDRTDLPLDLLRDPSCIAAPGKESDQGFTPGLSLKVNVSCRDDPANLFMILPIT